MLFFPPFLNLAFFALLCMFPTKTLATDHNTQHKKPWLDAMIPKSDAGNAVLATLFTATLAALAAWFSTRVIRDYGWTLFLGIPFIQGMTAAVLFGCHRPRRLRESISVAMISVAITALIVFVLAVEGLLCIAMAAPIAFPMAVLGGIAGHAIQYRHLSGATSVVLVLAALPLLSGVEKQSDRQPALVAVTTSVIIDRSPQDVWTSW